MVRDRGRASQNASPPIQKLMEEVRELRFIVAAIEASRTKTDKTRERPDTGSAVPELT
jgi:hypothetical protein